jgi:hypothetical protein
MDLIPFSLLYNILNMNTNSLIQVTNFGKPGHVENFNLFEQNQVTVCDLFPHVENFNLFEQNQVTICDMFPYMQSFTHSKCSADSSYILNFLLLT